MDPATVPDFDDLPPVKDMPQGCAWGIFDKDGEKDRVGTLNFLTPEIVKNAASEVKEGISVTLNWPINAMSAAPGRKAPVHTPIYLPDIMPMIGDTSSWDDELDFNTQCSSQWDSLVHFAHQESKLSYNGVNVTAEGLSISSTANNELPSLEHWHSRGCLVTRGVLIDYVEYARVKGIPFHSLDGTAISVKDVEDVARFQGVEFKHGDLFLLRTGFTEVVDSPSPEDLARFANMKLSGIEGSVDVARWFWNHRFSAVASDNGGFEVYPPTKPDGTAGGMADLVLHQYLLAMFGMSIGEMWDLGKLAEQCKKSGRYSFMVTSAPLNHPGLVASPPNAVAIF